MSSLFENAPVTLGVFITTVLFSFLFGGTGLVQFDPNRIMHGGEIWRFLFGHLAFRSMAQTVVGLILLYIYRSFERQMGSRKYGGFLFLSWMYSSIIYAILLLMTNSAIFNFSPSSGPFFFIFAQLAFFYRYIPKIFQNQYVLLGISFSEKSGIYLLAAQLFFSDGWESMVASLIALSFGFLYSQNIVRIQQFRLPSVVENFFITVSTAVSALTPRLRAPNGRSAQIPLAPTRGNGDWLPEQRPNGSDFFGNFPENQPTFQSLSEPDEESINSLTSLGFERTAAIQALRASGNNVDAAANRLLR